MLSLPPCHCGALSLEPVLHTLLPLLKLHLLNRFIAEPIFAGERKVTSKQAGGELEPADDPAHDCHFPGSGREEGK